MLSLSDIENEHVTDSNIISEVETENAALSKKSGKGQLKKIRPVTYAQSNRRIK